MTIQTIFNTVIGLLVAVHGVAATTAHAESSCEGVNLTTVEWTTTYNINGKYVSNDRINLEAEARQRHYLGPCDQYRIADNGRGTLRLADASKARWEWFSARGHRSTTPQEGAGLIQLIWGMRFASAAPVSPNKPVTRR
jgi:hypothetical protein